MKRKGFIALIVVIVLLLAAIWFVTRHQIRAGRTDDVKAVRENKDGETDVAGGGETGETGSDAAGGGETGETGSDVAGNDAAGEVAAGADGSAAGTAVSETGANVPGAGQDAGAGTNGSADGVDADGTSGGQALPGGADAAALPKEESISWDETWEYAEYSKIHTDDVTLYHADAPGRKDIVVAINAGHGCSGGSSEQTQCHPDGTPKVTGGSTGAGAVTATAINEGATMLDGTSEAAVNLSLARLAKDALLEAGYDVLMIRDNDDTQLDNIARTVFANNCADCHLAIHYDSTDSDKGFFYIRVPDVASYKAMEPVASHWEQHDALGEAILQGMQEQESVKISGGGSIALDLTQTSYSTVPSVDVEFGDRASDCSEETQRVLAQGIVAGVGHYFETLI